MPRRKGKEDDRKAGTDTIRVSKDLAHKLTLIATRRNVSISDLVSPQLRPWVEKLYREMVREMNAELDEAEG